MKLTETTSALMGDAPAAARIGYIRTLDGWRAIAVSAVIFYHSRAVPIGWLAGLQKFGQFGVQLFFAISGFLICSRLLEEQRLNGQISLRNFYVRRFFRIQPAAFAYLGGLGILAIFGVIHLTLPATLSAAFLYRNYYTVSHVFPLPDDVLTEHFWSLAVEEHFYLVLPALIYFGRKHLIKILSVLTILFIAMARLGLHATSDGSRELYPWSADAHLRNLLIPALLAVLLLNTSFRSSLTKISRKNALVIAVVLTILTSKLFLGDLLLDSIVAIGFPLLVLSTVLHSDDRLGKFLEWAPLVFIGRISYSLYLWQQIFITKSDRPWLAIYQHAPWNILVTFLCACASYYWIEKPLIRLGHRLAPPATPGRPDLVLPHSA